MMPLDVRSPIADALRQGLPVVALESTLIAHGLPWPTNLETARAAEAAVRAAGATPATIAVLAGRPTIGLDDAELEHLAQAGPAHPQGEPSRPRRRRRAESDGGDDGSGDDAACGCRRGAHLRHRRHRRRASRLALGRVGRLARTEPHARLRRLRRGQEHPRFAGDARGAGDARRPRRRLRLRCLSRVLCKLAQAYRFPHGSILPPRRPICSSLIGHYQVAASYWRYRSAKRTPSRRRRSTTPCAMPSDWRRQKACAGAALTPFLLQRLAEATGGRTLRANTALVVANAALAGAVAVAWSRPCGH